MKRVIIYIAIMLGSFVICNAQKIEQRAMCGIFDKCVNRKYFNIETFYSLELNADSTFTFVINHQDARPKGVGKWKIIDTCFISLELEEPSVEECLTSGYMSERKIKMRIININKIKYKDVILKRKR
ncbi:MAG: hypothetical protein LKM37_03275 [Bacteroidales bacterium]|jgi:hypothetical protein|nr:hypothetical protein [Bacteroidales bacterium]